MLYINEYKKLVVRKSELVKRDKECKQWEEMLKDEEKMSDEKTKYCEKARKELNEAIIKILDMENQED